MVFRIKPAPPKPPTPQCDEPYDELSYADHYISHRSKELQREGKDPSRCRNPSSFKIGSKCYCTPHAGRHLIALVEEGRIKLPEDLP